MMVTRMLLRLLSQQLQVVTAGQDASLNHSPVQSLERPGRAVAAVQTLLRHPTHRILLFVRHTSLGAVVVRNLGTWWHDKRVITNVLVYIEDVRSIERVIDYCVRRTNLYSTTELTNSIVDCIYLLSKLCLGDVLAAKCASLTSLLKNCRVERHQLALTSLNSI